MTDLTAFGGPAAKGQTKSLLNLDERTRKRNQSEARFRLLGKAAVAFGIICLVGLLASILSNGVSSFQQTFISIDVFLDPAKLDPAGNRNRADIAKVSTFAYAPLIEKALGDAIAAKGLAAEGLTPKAAAELISKEAPGNLRSYVLDDPSVVGTTVSFDLLAAGRIDGYYKGRVTMESAKLDRNVSPEQLVLADTLKPPTRVRKPPVSASPSSARPT
jgi:phosphate transport system permease protein